MIKISIFFLLLLIFSISGCASLSYPRIEAFLARPRDCEEFFMQLDEKVKGAKVHDASSVPISGFPYLRTNRFLSTMKERLKGEGELKEWVSWMYELNLQSREKEIKNLPQEILPSLSSNQEELLARMKTCSQDLLRHDTQNSQFYSFLKPRVVVPDEYSFFLRIVGFYPLLAIPVSAVTENARRKMKARFETNLEALPRDGILYHYGPEKWLSLSEKEIKEILRDSRGNSLNTPKLDRAQAKSLVEHFAPVIIQDVAAPYDCFGQLIWKNGRAEVDPDRPVVYYYLSNGFMKGEPILQINYVIWFSERAGKNPPRIEKGHLDGLTIRISLDSEGSPFMVDIQNNCGCYHFFVPERRRLDQVTSRPLMFDPLILQFLPEVLADQRFGVLINSGWHQPQRLLAVGEPSNPIPYKLVPYEDLESLKHEDGRRESLFDEKGIAKSSRRIERFILFSMGIPKIGSMRQRGHHAIELFGREHFDDPNLFDKNFIFK